MRERLIGMSRVPTSRVVVRVIKKNVLYKYDFLLSLTRVAPNYIPAGICVDASRPR